MRSEIVHRLFGGSVRWSWLLLAPWVCMAALVAAVQASSLSNDIYGLVWDTHPGAKFDTANPPDEDGAFLGAFGHISLSNVLGEATGMGVLQARVPADGEGKVNGWYVQFGYDGLISPKVPADMSAFSNGVLEFDVNTSAYLDMKIEYDSGTEHNWALLWVDDYAPSNYFDGAWHHVSVPLQDFYGSPNWVDFRKITVPICLMTYQGDVTFSIRNAVWKRTARLRGDKPLQGVCYGPFRNGQAPGVAYPSVAEITEDLGRLSLLTESIRTYSSSSNLFHVARLCDRLGLDCYAGAWLSTDSVQNARELADLTAIADAGYETTRGLIVGNETVLRGDMTTEDLVTIITNVAEMTDIPVTTAEPWHIWMSHTQLVEAVDFIMAHVHPYWEGIPESTAAAYTTNRCAELCQRYPGKTVVLGECGWPTAGDPCGSSVPGESHQAELLRSLIPAMDSLGLRYFLFEAADESWKTAEPYGVGPHWGVLYASRLMKPFLENFISNEVGLVDVELSGGELHLPVRTFEGHAYALDAAPQLTNGAWNTIAEFGGANAANATALHVPLREGDTQRFYRVRWEQD